MIKIQKPEFSWRVLLTRAFKAVAGCFLIILSNAVIPITGWLFLQTLFGCLLCYAGFRLIGDVVFDINKVQKP